MAYFFVTLCSQYPNICYFYNLMVADKEKWHILRKTNHWRYANKEHLAWDSEFSRGFQKVPYGGSSPVEMKCVFGNKNNAKIVARAFGSV